MANNQIFNSVPVDRVKKSRFDLSHEVKTTTQMGKLTPILCKEVVPGDNVRLSTQGFIRTAPLVAPVYHRIDSYVHHFFVPCRILVQGYGEDNIWQKFITGGKDGTDTTVLPYITIDDLASFPLWDSDPQWLAAMGPSSIWCYMGLPSPTTLGYANSGAFEAGATSPQKISLLPFAALMRIAIDYFLDENYISAELLGTGKQLHEGHYVTPAVPADRAWVQNWVMGQKVAATWTDGTYRRAYEKDYFTSALPWAQRGGEVLIPMDAEVTYSPVSTVVGAGASGNNEYLGSEPGAFPKDLQAFDSITTGLIGDRRIENIESISNSTITINDLRTAIVVQRWLENSARGGYKYNESIFVHFGQTIPDYRLDRAEYLGGGRSPVQIGEVTATATSVDAEDQTLPQGNMAGRGMSYQESNQFSYKCQEHGFIISIFSTIPRTGYYQGLGKMWTREVKEDYLWPEFANLGEQVVKSDELWWDLSGTGLGEFGYQQRYAEYKYAMDTISGDFVDTLSFWTLARTFDDTMAQGENSQDFIQVDPAEQTRIFAVETGDNLWCHFRHDLSIIRPLPYYSVPGVTKI